MSWTYTSPASYGSSVVDRDLGLEGQVMHPDSARHCRSITSPYQERMKQINSMCRMDKRKIMIGSVQLEKQNVQSDGKTILDWTKLPFDRKKQKDLWTSPSWKFCLLRLDEPQMFSNSFSWTNLKHQLQTESFRSYKNLNLRQDKKKGVGCPTD